MIEALLTILSEVFIFPWPVKEEDTERNTLSECECCGQRYREDRAQNQGGGVT